MILSKGNCHPSWSLSAKGSTWQQAVPWNKSSWCLHANESCEEKVDHPILPRLANFVQKWVANENSGKWVLMFNVYYCDPCKCCISEGTTADWCTPDIWGLYFVLIPSCVNILTNFMKMADCNCWMMTRCWRFYTELIINRDRAVSGDHELKLWFVFQRNKLNFTTIQV